MSCLLPHFNCQPDTFSIHFKPNNHNHASSHTHTLLSRSRESNYFRLQCILSTTSSTLMATTTTLDVEKLRFSSLESRSNSATSDRPWTYLGATGPPTEANFKATLATETLLTSDEAVIAAAAAEAVALARAAVKVAKDAALMVNGANSAKTESEPANPSRTETISSKFALLTKSERTSMVGDSILAETRLGKAFPIQYSIDDSDVLEPTNEELMLLQEQLSNSITVKSKRQNERKARRTRAAEKAAANVVSVKSGSSSRKKQASSQEVDYSDPLRYLRGTTSTCKLLTLAEELELSEGIQDLLKLERLQKELMERCGGQPTFTQWAAAARVDQKTLRQRLNYGIFCKDKMIKSNIRLVISIAKNYQGVGMNLQDLVQEGCRGLIRGAEKFDASKGFKFSTYGHWWIKQAVRKSLSDQSRIIRLPCHMVEATYRVKEARKKLYSETGRHPDNEEVAAAAGISMKRLTAVLLTPKAPRSLDQKIGMYQNLKPSETIAAPDAETADDLLMKQFMKQDLDKVLNSLSLRERQVIRMRFGLVDGRMKTLQEIGELMGVSRERIRQIESCAFRKLKNKKRTKHLQQYTLS
ncbi:Sigma70_r1_2 domain-containing protein/Sigma70_r3 domain-containing protein/Sigma70_r2 domain-containing protein/Sigma70_r4 domain-containing protein [Cephalotus follicularis]|uniref:RNA polymerase sigma factor n=1 Tax=Cephalotus follicularis TaxID=3775 RepID=A0A1Q3D9Y7_CEPFO|nr:Sigma70_r1_2 domain-containing protein/Sigma70_r3 domain-containing protein/Sigma70_r2 domain-containing protein/Sigma70_r4 domain-containing protein [Cephalotus follicularis]